MIFRAGQGAGASGSFFFFSYNKKFLIKTITKEEINVLTSMLDEYTMYLTENTHRSLIARIYGIYTIKLRNYSQ